MRKESGKGLTSGSPFGLILGFALPMLLGLLFQQFYNMVDTMVVGQCLGAGRQDEAIYYIKKLSVIAEAVIIGCCALVYILTRPVTMLGGMEPESAKMCFYMIGWITVVKPIVWTLAFVPAYGMRAAGDVRFSMILSCISMWLFRVTLCIYLCRVHGFGPIAVWIGMFTDWTVRGIVFTIRFKSRRWLAHEVL